MKFGLSSSSETEGDEAGPFPSSSKQQLYLRVDPRTKTAREGVQPSAAATTSSSKKALSSGDDLSFRPAPPTPSSYKQPRRSQSDADPERRIPPSTSRRLKKVVPPWIKQPSALSSDEDDDELSHTSLRQSQPRLPSSSSAARSRRSRSRLVRARSASFGISAAISDSSASALSSDDGDEAGRSDDSNAFSSSSGLDTSDSEEIEWPVAPGRKGTGSRKVVKKDKAAIRSVRLAADQSLWGQEWMDAPPPSNSWRTSFKRRSVQLQPQNTASKTTSAAFNPLLEDDFEQVQSLLSSLALQKAEADRKDRQEFQAREKKLWTSIEDAIRKAEEEAREKAKEEAERLAAARKAQEEAERKAKEAKAAEEKRIEEEQAANEEAKKQQEEQKQLDAAAAKKKQEEEAARERDKGMGGGDALRAQARLDYRVWADKMKHIKENVLPVISSNPTWRKQCFQAKRQITPKIGQLTNTREEIWRITTLISNLLTEAKAAPAPNQEIYTWVLNHLSKCLIRQAEQEVSVKIDTAYPLARLVIWLILEGHKELGDVLMARLVKKCCWCLGYVPERKTDQDDASFSKTIGRASPEESSVQFTSRISGIAAFYFAICQTQPSSPSKSDASLIPAHFRSAALWTWQARCITPPMTSHAIVPALWATLIEVAGDVILKYYGRQAQKVWTLLYSQGILGGKADFIRLEEGKAASGRLQLLLEDVVQRGRVDVPKGREMG